MSDLFFGLLGAFFKLISMVLGYLFKFLILPALGVAIVGGILYALYCAIRNAINPPPPPPTETAPPNLRSGTDKQCKNCFYCGRNMSENGGGLAHLCTKHHTTISKYYVCDDFESQIDIIFRNK